MTPSAQQTSALIDDSALRTPRPVPDAGVVAKLRASALLRRVVPTELALVLIGWVYALSLKASKGRRAATERTLDAIVGGTPVEDQISSLAVAHVVGQARGWELTFRPEAMSRLPYSGAEEIAEARTTGRGVLISINHMGPFIGWTGLGECGVPVTAVVGDWMSDDPRAGYEGYQLEARRRVLAMGKMTYIPALNSARTVLSLLKQGEVVMIATDLPGSAKTEFLGKTVEMHNGTARLAKSTKALVIPGSLIPDGRRWSMKIGKALDPNDFLSATELHQAIADAHAAFILSGPEHLEDPLRFGGWAHADRTGWRTD